MPHFGTIEKEHLFGSIIHHIPDHGDQFTVAIVADPAFINNSGGKEHIVCPDILNGSPSLRSNHTCPLNGIQSPAGIPFYYLPMGETQWQTLMMNDDGCFGKVGGHDVLRGAKGWLAFPIKDMLQAGTKDALCSEDVITTAYLYYSLNHEEPETYGQYIIIDDIALAEDYKVF